MTEEQLRSKQASMSNEELIELVEKEITNLAKSGGGSHKMCVPPMITDTDMLLSELVRRYKQILPPKPTKIQIDFIVDDDDHVAVTGLKELIINGITEPVKEIKPGTYRKLSDINNS